jgi:trans-aconitate 2-methyltransferase
MTKDPLKSYVIKGGDTGRARLSVLARALAPTTEALLDRAGSLEGATIVDVGCGGGDVTFALVQRAGANGRVLGIDLDETKLAAARADAASRGLDNVRFEAVDVTKRWPVKDARLVYARFILTHLKNPLELLEQAMTALAPGGMIIAEDIDFDGRFSYPDSEALEKADALYVQAVQKRGGDPFIGRRLLALIEDGGFAEAGISLVQPFGREGDAKAIASLTFAAIADSVVELGLASREEVSRIQREAEAFTARKDTIISLPRIFEAWGVKPR